MPGFSRQAFYEWQENPVSDRDWANAHLINMALDIHSDDPPFGYRFSANQLAEHGIAAPENRVHRLCQADLVGVRQEARAFTSCRPAGARRPG